MSSYGYSATRPQQKPAQSPDTTRLTQFLAEILSVGCIKGFRNFHMYVRGREELLIRLHTGAINNANVYQINARDAVSSMKQGAPLSGPLDPDTEQDAGVTTFLIAAYARYGQPFAWPRTKSERVAKIREEQHLEPDMPINLKSTANWSQQGVKLFEIIDDITALVMQPPPFNPFAVDHKYFETLPVEESIIRIGAMMEFLQQVYAADHAYSDDVLQDMKQLQAKLFRDFSRLPQ
ncbi:hypothetical protein HDV00_011603 [Rhizophlyctis rosea]|nr:hypothetical protein HDV00_011603 [Rhizophlyctis rosea]